MSSIKRIISLTQITSADLYEHLYSPRMVGEIKEKKQLEHQTNKQTNSDMT